MNGDTVTTGGSMKGGAASIIALIVLIIIGVVIALAIGGTGKRNDAMNTAGMNQETSSTSANASIDAEFNQMGKDIDGTNMDSVSF
jgi:competence protein ComGC